MSTSSESALAFLASGDAEIDIRCPAPSGALLGASALPKLSMERAGLFRKILVVLLIFPGSPVEPVAVSLCKSVQTTLGWALEILVSFAFTNFATIGSCCQDLGSLRIFRIANLGGLARSKSRSFLEAYRRHGFVFGQLDSL